MNVRRVIVLALGSLALAASLAQAAEITRSPIPKLRPGTPEAVAPPAAPQGEVMPLSQALGEPTSPRPAARPRGLRRLFAGNSSNKPPRSILSGTAGSVCGVAAIKGASVPAIPGRLAGCGVEAPVRITEVAGITLSTPATMDCTTAKALNAWVDKAVEPGFRRMGGGVTQLKVAAGYSCRPRNNQKGAKISEHGRGRAIDISGFTLANGSLVTVKDGWRSGREGRVLKKLHAAACGPFGTVLGPNSDRFHHDHFHLDTARYRSGSYCR